jgi:Tfp pilus assembly protein PilF
MPHPRNDDFVGRKRLLRQLRRALRPEAGDSRAVALVQAIHGLGGVGKTQLAIRYVYEHAADYDAVLWLTADPPAKLASDYADLARPLGLPEATRTTDVNEQIAAVRRWLESDGSGRWLLVFDNAESPEALRDYLPARHAGHVLITSRRPRWERPARTIEVQTMERRESVRLLLGRSGQSDAVAAGELAEALGDLPLALAQAAGYLADSGLSFADYLDLFRQRRAELLQRGEPPDTYRLTVFATFDLALRQIDRAEVEDLVGLIACLAPDEIPRQLLQAGLGDPLRLADALAALGRHSLIQAGPQVVEVHRLVQAVAWDRMPPEAQARQAERAVRLLEGAFPGESQDVRTWEECKALQPHADHATRLAEQCQVALDTVGKLLDRVGVFDEYRARLREARARFRRVLAIKETAFGPEDPRIARTLGNLGNVAQKQGDLSGARALQERALRIFEAAYGPEHPEVANTLTNLGIVAELQGDLSGARALQERALCLKEAAYGPEHPEVARTLNNLGIVAHLQGDLCGARALQERALRTQETAYGPGHPQVALSLGNLGNVAQEQGDLSGALALYERALRIEEAAYGPEHPAVATTLGNLGNVALHQGDLSGARALQEQALRIEEAAYGPEHPEVARTLGNLGNVALHQGDLCGGRALQERALRINEAAYGPEHPAVAITLGNLGIVALHQGDLSGARALQERALCIEEAAYGPEHPEVARTLANLGRLLGQTGAVGEAAPLVARGLNILQRSLGEEHPTTTWARGVLQEIAGAARGTGPTQEPPGGGGTTDPSPGGGLEPD